MEYPIAQKMVLMLGQQGAATQPGILVDIFMTFVFFFELVVFFYKTVWVTGFILMKGDFVFPVTRVIKCVWVLLSSLPPRVAIITVL